MNAFQEKFLEHVKPQVSSPTVKPVLVHNGKYYNESLAILRYVGHKFGRYPTDATDAEAAWEVDSIVDWANDYIGKLVPIFVVKKDFGEESLAEFAKIIQGFVDFIAKKITTNGTEWAAGQ